MIPDTYFDRFSTPKYRGGHRLKRVLLRRFVERFHSLFLRASPVESVLEVGMGEGFLSGYLSERFPRVRFEGIDRDTGALSRAITLFPRIEVREGSAYDLRAIGRSFDLVLCCEVLEHLQNPEWALTEIAALGCQHAIITVPHEPFSRFANLLPGQAITCFGDDGDHRHRWDARSFRSLLSVRFEVVELTKAYPFLLALVSPRAS